MDSSVNSQRRPVCQQSWSRGLLLRRTRRFFPSGGCSQYSLLPTHRGMAQAESTWVPGSVTRWFTRPKMVTHPGTNRVRCRVTTLIESNALHCYAGTKRGSQNKLRCSCLFLFCDVHLEAASSEHKAETSSKAAISPVRWKKVDSVKGC